MSTLKKGQKSDITKNNPAIGDIVVGMGWKVGADIDVDFSAFLLCPDGKVVGDADLIFYGNPRSVDGSVIIAGDAKSSFGGTIDREQVLVKLKHVPAELDRISFTLTIYEGDARKQNFSRVDDAYIRVINISSGTELLRYDIGKDFSVETAIVIGDLYRYHGEWKFNAVGSGYSGGLGALCGRFGIKLQDETPSAQPKPESAGIQSAPQPQVTKPSEPASQLSKPAPAAPPIRQSKISLTKRNGAINLQRGTDSLGEIVVNLNWNRQKSSGGGFFKRRSVSDVDLDLACLFEMKNGRKGVVQALGRQFGSYAYSPYISLDGDDRTGVKANGENLRINGNKVGQIKRILVFAFIYEGVNNWSQADGVVTIKQAGGPDIEVRLDQHDNRKGTCAIAMIENVDGQTFSIKRLVKYYSGHIELDKAYNWGIQWGAPSEK
ncbi:TerD family protein [Paenibacillus periandrae]|uniref:TerD family protein n=1 Tax=Paenibacillus periandrae TaxID=1761741 RepID=UPI003B82FF6E